MDEIIDQEVICLIQPDSDETKFVDEDELGSEKRRTQLRSLIRRFRELSTDSRTSDATRRLVADQFIIFVFDVDYHDLEVKVQ